MHLNALDFEMKKAKFKGAKIGAFNGILALSNL